MKKTKDEVVKLEQKLEDGISSYRHMVGLWNEFNPELISVKDVKLSTKKIAGVIVPVLDKIDFEVKPFSLFNSPSWFSEGLELLKVLATTGIEAEFLGLKLEFLEYARKKTTQNRSQGIRMLFVRLSDTLKMKRVSLNRPRRSCEPILKNANAKKRRHCYD